MQREQLEHVVAAAAEILASDRFVVIGSQAIHGAVPDPPVVMLTSLEVDLYPADAPERAIEIEGALGDGSMFHATFGYYAHAVGPETAQAPAGWKERLVPIEIPPRVTSQRKPLALCLERHDLVLAKAVAGRAHDLIFIHAAIRAQLVDITELARRVRTLPIDDHHRQRVRETVNALHHAAQRPWARTGGRECE